MNANASLSFFRSGKVAKNRSLLAAMTNKQSHPDGTLSEEEIRWLVRRGNGGFGITTTAATNVTETGKGWEGEMGAWGDHQLAGLTQLATQLNATGTLSLVQLFHGILVVDEDDDQCFQRAAYELADVSPHQADNLREL